MVSFTTGLLLVHIYTFMYVSIKKTVHPIINIYSSSCRSKPVWLTFFWGMRYFLSIQSQKCLVLFWTPLTLIMWRKTTVNIFNISYFVMHRRKLYRFGTTWGWLNNDNVNFWINTCDQSDLLVHIWHALLLFGSYVSFLLFWLLCCKYQTCR